jgi:flagellar FliJ protein
MKRFRFDLEKLLELRSYREHEAELELAHAIGNLTLIQNQITQLAQERSAAAQERFSPGKTVVEMRRTDAYILRLDKDRDRLLEAAVKAELKVDEARSAFAEARRDRLVLDKLKDKRKAEHRKEAMKEEIETLDDISSGTVARRLINT